MTKKLSMFLVAGCALTTSVLFQNCGGGGFAALSGASRGVASLSTNLSTAPAADSNTATATPEVPAVGMFASANSVTTTSGKSLSFTNTQGLSIGTATVTANASDFTVRLYNTLAGRSSSVKVKVDNTGNILSVWPNTAQPYMCHDANTDPCTQYSNITSGDLESNCQSPIYFSGAISGSVLNQTSAPSGNCSSSSASHNTVCFVKFSDGGVIQTINQNQAQCAAECRGNANANAGLSVACKFNGQSISF